MEKKNDIKLMIIKVNLDLENRKKLTLSGVI